MKTKTSAEQIIFDRLLSIGSYLRMSYRHKHYFVNSLIPDQLADIVIKFQDDVPDSELSKIANSLTTSDMPIIFKLSSSGVGGTKYLNLYINHLQYDQVQIKAENVKSLKHEKSLGWNFNLQVN